MTLDESTRTLFSFPSDTRDSPLLFRVCEGSSRGSRRVPVFDESTVSLSTLRNSDRKDSRTGSNRLWLIERRTKCFLTPGLFYRLFVFWWECLMDYLSRSFHQIFHQTRREAVDRDRGPVGWESRPKRPTRGLRVTVPTFSEYLEDRWVRRMSTPLPGCRTQKTSSVDTSTVL